MTEPTDSGHGTRLESLAADPSVRPDLQAAIGARLELGAEMEEHVVEAFLDRIDKQLDARVQAIVKGSKEARPSRLHSFSGGDSLALAIPLVVVGGIFGGAFGIAAVMACVVLVNILYLLVDVVSHD